MAWNRLICLKNAILDLIKDMEIDSDRDVRYDFKRLKKILLSNDEWSLIEELLLILKDFNDITNTLSGNSYVTLSLVYPTMSHLINKIKSQLYEEDNIESSDEFIPSPDIDEIILEPPNSNETEGSSIDDATEEMDDIFMQAGENEAGEIEILEEQNGERLKKKIKISKAMETYGLKSKILDALYNSLINKCSVIPQM